MCVYRNRGKCVDTSLELFSPLKGGRDTMEGKHGDLGIVLHFFRVCVVCGKQAALVCLSLL